MSNFRQSPHHNFKLDKYSEYLKLNFYPDFGSKNYPLSIFLDVNQKGKKNASQFVSAISRLIKFSKNGIKPKDSSFISIFGWKSFPSVGEAEQVIKKFFPENKVYPVYKSKSNLVSKFVPIAFVDAIEKNMLNYITSIDVGKNTVLIMFNYRDRYFFINQFDHGDGRISFSFLPKFKKFTSNSAFFYELLSSLDL